MGSNLAISVNWAKGHSDVLKCFTASTCTNPCEWITTGLKPSLFLAWKNPIMSLAPPTRCHSPLAECEGKAGPWVTDKSYAEHWRKLHHTTAPLRVIFILIQSFTILIYDFFLKDCSVPGCREKHIRLQHHILNQHRYALPPAICRLCREKFQTEEALEEHWEDTHQDKTKDKHSNISCTICQQQLSNNFKDCSYHTC